MLFLMTSVLRWKYFEQVYEHECRVSKMIDALVDVAAAEKDKASQDFLWGFVREQVRRRSYCIGHRRYGEESRCYRNLSLLMRSWVKENKRKSNKEIGW